MRFLDIANWIRPADLVAESSSMANAYKEFNRMSRGDAIMYGAPSAPWHVPPPAGPKVPFGIEPLEPAPLEDAIRQFIKEPSPAPVDPPPPYAADAELAAIEAFYKLDEEARQRVLRYLEARFGKAKP